MTVYYVIPTLLAVLISYLSYCYAKKLTQEDRESEKESEQESSFRDDDMMNY